LRKNQKENLPKVKKGEHEKKKDPGTKREKLGSPKCGYGGTKDPSKLGGNKEKGGGKGI